MRAILLASATAASLGGLRFSRSASQGDGGLSLPAFAASHLLDHGGGADHQHAAQGLVAGAGDRRRAGSCRPSSDPSASARSRPRSGGRSGRLRVGRLSSTSSEAPIGPMPGIFARRRLASFCAVPGHQLGLDRLQLRLQLGIFLGVPGKQLACQRRQRRLGVQARQQRLDLVDALAPRSARTRPHSRGSHWSAGCGGGSAGRACRPASAPPAARRS